MFMLAASYGGSACAESKVGEIAVGDEAAYTEYFKNTMKKLGSLCLGVCDVCNVDAATAVKARKDYYETVRELLQGMNVKI